MKTRLIFALLLLLSSLLLHPSSFAQGPLAPPPGLPGPTMKTLDQVEARTPIDATHTLGDANNLFVIATPGSYYLTGNITGVSGKSGISIRADNVTVDLNGFALIGVTGSLNGITVATPRRNLRIHNGSAQSWDGAGIQCDNATNSQFDHLRVSQNGAGLRCGDGNVLSEISAEANTGFDGISTGDGCTLTACYAAKNNLNGISTGASCTVTASTAVANLKGFNTHSLCTIIGCTAFSNSSIGISPSNGCTIKNCTAALNGIGIAAFSSSLIVNCTASENTANGISFFDDNLITGNNASKNGGDGFHSSGTLNRLEGNTANYNIKDGFLLGDGSVIIGCTANSNAIGIHTTGGQNRLEGNATINNPTGFKVEAAGNLIIKNSNTGGTTPFNLATGNSVGEMIDVYKSGAGATITSTNSWANFLY